MPAMSSLTKHAFCGVCSLRLSLLSMHARVYDGDRVNTRETLRAFVHLAPESSDVTSTESRVRIKVRFVPPTQQIAAYRNTE